MKTVVRVAEVDGEGLESLLNEKVQLWCLNYIYTGTLIGVNDNDVKLKDAYVVYETGPLQDASWKDAQAHADVLYVRTSSIESYCKTKR